MADELIYLMGKQWSIPDYALEHFHIYVIQGELCVRLRELRVKIGLNSNPEHFIAEAGEEDAEFAEEKQILVLQTKSANAQSEFNGDHAP